MDSFDFSIEGISAFKAQQISQKAEVAIFRKALDTQAAITTKIIDSAVQILPDGVGEKLNTTA